MKTLFTLFILLSLLLSVSFSHRIKLQRKPHRLHFEEVAGSGGVTVKLSGGIAALGEYYATIQLGKPAASFDLQVDTGSSDLLVDTTNCNGCGSNHQLFDPSTSQNWPVSCNSPGDFTCPTCWKGNCGFNDQYGDGSGVQGYVTYTQATIGSLSANSSIGLIENSTKNFEPKGVDGIWGLAYSKLADWSEPTVIADLINSNNLNQAFSMCLSSNGGTFDIGDDFSSGFEYTPVTKQLWYVVEMDDFLVGSKSIGVPSTVYNSQGTIVDSGTTLFYLPSQAFNAFQTAVEDLCKSGQNLVGVCNVKNGQSLFDGYCFQMSQSQVSAFPTVSVSLKGVSNLPVQPTAYLVAQNGYYCLGIQDSGNLAFTILGDVFMQDRQVVFDFGNNQVGFGSC